MVKELHNRGFGKLIVIPSISPSGLAWRCQFFNKTREYEVIASFWIENYENEGYQVEIKSSPLELAEFFINENVNFIEHCKGKNQEYEKWYDHMLEGLKDDELPYVSDKYEQNYWLTTKNYEIKTLPKEK